MIFKLPSFTKTPMATLALMLVLPLLAACSRTQADPKPEIDEGVTPQMVTTVQADMKALIASTSEMKIPDSLNARMTDEYRNQISQNPNDPGANPWLALDFHAFVSNLIPKMSMLSQPNDIAEMHSMEEATKGITTFPASFLHRGHFTLLDRWYLDKTAPARQMSIFADSSGDVTATQWVPLFAEPQHGISRQTQELTYSITYRMSDMKIISIGLPCWFFSIYVPLEVDPTAYVSNFHRIAPTKMFADKLGDYTVIDTDSQGFNYLNAVRSGNRTIAPDDGILNQAASIVKVAIPYRIANWNFVYRNPAVPDNGIARINGGIRAVIPFMLEIGNSTPVVFAGFSLDSSNVVTTIPIYDATISKWLEKVDDGRFVSNAFIKVYVLGTLSPALSHAGRLVLTPERVVATSYDEIQYADSSVLVPGGHPIVTVASDEETVADYDVQPDVAAVLAAQAAKAAALHQRPVSQYHWR